jgi:hypothetical protein
MSALLLAAAALAGATMAATSQSVSGPATKPAAAKSATKPASPPKPASSAAKPPATKPSAATKAPPVARTTAPASPWPAGVPGVVDLGLAVDVAKALPAAMAARDTEIVVLPEGTFGLAGPVSVDHLLIGAGSDKTILRITPGLPRKAPADSPKIAVQLKARLEGVTIELPPGCDGAIGVTMGNGASLVDVVLKADASPQVGIGLSEGASDEDEPPSHVRGYLQRVRVDGFARGVQARGQACLLTADGLELRGQADGGIIIDGACAALHNVTADSETTVLKAAAASVVALRNASFVGHGSASTQPAVVSQGAIAVRNLTTSGFKSAASSGPAGDKLAEWWSQPQAALATGGDAKTPGPIEMQAAPPGFRPASDQWANGCASQPADATCISWGKPVTVKNWTPAIHAAADSGRPAVYLPPDQAHALFGTLKLPATLRLLDGMRGGLHQIFHGSGAMYGGVIEVGDGESPLEIRDLSMGLANITIRHTGKRVLVLRNVSGFVYEADAGAGDLHIIHCAPVSMKLAAGQRCWARSLDLTGHSDTLIRNGGQLSGLGISSSRWQTVVANTDVGAAADIFGGLVVARSWRPKDPMFSVVPGSSLSALLGESPGSPVAYERLVADQSGKVLLSRAAAPKRSAGSEDRAAGSVVSFAAK